MHSQFLATVSLALVALVVRSVSAVGCFSGGESGNCSGAIDTICNAINGVVFSAGQTVSVCVNEDGFRCNMAVQNTGGGGSSIGVQECKDDMDATNNGCSGHGGVRADGNFQLTLDPNAGAC